MHIVQLQGGTAGTVHLRTQDSIPEDTGSLAECVQTGRSTAVSLEGAEHSLHSQNADCLTHVHSTKTSASSVQRQTVLPKRHCGRLRAGQGAEGQFYRPSGGLRGRGRSRQGRNIFQKLPPLTYLVLCACGIVAYQSRTRQEGHLVCPCEEGTATEVHCLQLHTPQTKTLIPMHPQTLQS